MAKEKNRLFLMKPFSVFDETVAAKHHMLNAGSKYYSNRASLLGMIFKGSSNTMFICSGNVGSKVDSQPATHTNNVANYRPWFISNQPITLAPCTTTTAVKIKVNVEKVSIAASKLAGQAKEWYRLHAAHNPALTSGEYTPDRKMKTYCSGVGKL
jgi:hypothetical protein